MTFQASKYKIALLNKLAIVWQGHTFHLHYFHREGRVGPQYYLWMD
jgi:hypothetical protein